MAGKTSALGDDGGMVARTNLRVIFVRNFQCDPLCTASLDALSQKGTADTMPRLYEPPKSKTKRRALLRPSSYMHRATNSGQGKQSAGDGSKADGKSAAGAKGIRGQDGSRMDNQQRSKSIDSELSMTWEDEYDFGNETPAKTKNKISVGKLGTATGGKRKVSNKSKTFRRTTTTTVTPSSPKKASHPPSRPFLSHRRALAIDTRTLETFTGDAAGKVVLNHVESFLHSVKTRGADPCIVASLVSREPSGPVNSPRIGKTSLRKAIEPTVSTDVSGLSVKAMLEPVSIRAPLNVGNKKNRQAVHVPKSLLAHDSWKFFGDLVEKIVEADGNSSDHVPPLDVTILTNDISLFSDTNQDSHRHGLKSFWDRCRPSFRSNAIKSIKVLVVETGVAALVDEANIENNDETMSTTLGSTELALYAEHRVNVAQCILAIESETVAKSDSDYRNRLSTEDTFVPVRVKIGTLENNLIAYNSIVRKWMTETVSPTHEARRIRFNLPETIDGTQCSVDLDLSYKVMPFRADSRMASGLLVDLKLLASSQLEVVQLVPINSIDASLIFGVPMLAAAGMESDLPRFREMQLLVRCLWRYLVDREVALVLRSTGGSGPSSESSHEYEPLYHMQGQTFLLMGEEIPGRRQSTQSEADLTEFSNIKISTEGVSGLSATCGVLFRYASDEQMLFSVDHNATASIQNESESAAAQSYADYIDSSLDILEREPLNPVFASCTLKPENGESGVLDLDKKTSPELLGQMPSEMEWTDESGVGTRPLMSSQGSATDELTKNDWKADTAFNEFEYE